MVIWFMLGVDWCSGVARDPQGGWGIGNWCRSTLFSHRSELMRKSKHFDNQM